MPTATLSLELQLRILDFAVPPRTFYNRGERERICRDLALVHYTWETRALSLLRQHAEYRGEDLSDWRAMYRGPKEAIAAGAKRFDISLGWNAVVDTRRPAPNTFGSGAAGLEELGLRRTTRRLTRGADFAMLEMIEAERLTAPLACPFLNDLPDSLRYLSIAHLTFGATEWSSILRLPHLDTLLLTGTGPTEQPDDGLLEQSKLRVLGYKATPAPNEYPTTLRHLALIGHWQDLLGEVVDDDWPAPPSFASLTVLALRPLDPYEDENEDDGYERISSEEITALEDSCQRKGISLRLSVVNADAEGDDFDLEEWAASVGANPL